MAQKVVRAGNSAAAIIPKSVLQESRLKIGSAINVAYKADLDTIVIEIPRKHTPTRALIDKEVYAVGQDLLARYLPAFKKLARA